MSDAKETKENTLSILDGVLTAIRLNGSMKVKKTDTDVSANYSLNPVDLLVDLFKRFGSYDDLIKTVSKFISYGMPALEIGIKGAILSYIQSLHSCSTNPVITKTLINEGVYFNMDEIDLLKIFRHSPIDKSKKNPGRYYYIDEKDCVDYKDANLPGGAPTIKYVDQLKYSRDMNSVLWYLRNSPGERVVWRDIRHVNEPYNLSQTVIAGAVNWSKQPMSNGIITIEYNGRSSNMTDAEHNPMHTQEPINQCIHIFPGCCVPLNNDDANRNSKATARANINDIEKLKETCDAYIRDVNDWYNTTESDAKKNHLSTNDLNNIKTRRDNDINALNELKSALSVIKGTIKNAVDRSTILSGQTTINLTTIYKSITIPLNVLSTNVLNEKGSLILSNGSITTNGYPPANTNYYYLHPLMEFNVDYLKSIQILDSKVVTARLLDLLLGMISCNVSLSLEEQLIKNKLRTLIERVIETDNGVVSDCFFSFSNDKYNAMLSEAELLRMGLNSMDGGQSVNRIPSADEILDELNSLDENATKEEIESAIESTIFKASGYATGLDDKRFSSSISIDFNNYDDTNMSIIDKIIQQLIESVVTMVISPKIYIILMFNLKIAGQEPNCDINKFIQMFNEMIVSIITSVRNQILDYLYDEFMKMFQKLLNTLMVSLSLEQYEYYYKLLTSCAECIKTFGNRYDWVMSDVNYADITELNNPVNEEC